MDSSEANALLMKLLNVMVKRDGSDLFVSAGHYPSIKVKGVMTPLGNKPLTEEESSAIVRSAMNDKQLKEFDETKECNFAIAPANIGRFRVNAFVQQGAQCLVARVINAEVPNIDKLGLPEVLKKIISEKNGLIIMVGGTGSGKSTSMAAMIDHRNESSYGHIVTIEDPLEYIHKPKNCVITHREVGVDTDSWEAALHNTLRQSPDVIVLGEIRDKEIMGFGLEFAQTGHLAMATLHANNANQAIDRILGFFPEEGKNKLMQDISLNLRAVISQRLVKTKDGGRAAAIEILINTPRVADLIADNDISGIKEIMAKSEGLGMQTFDSALFKLYLEGKITEEVAIANADSQNEVRLRIKLYKDGLEQGSRANEDSDTASNDDGLSGLSLVSDEPDASDSLSSEAVVDEDGTRTQWLTPSLSSMEGK
jgi:twitching motility protein PilU